MRGVFVTGTDTGADKSVVAAYKPIVTGTDEPAGEWPPDHELLAAAASAGQTPAEVAPRTFGPPVSPHWAAELAGELIDPAALVEGARAAAARADVLVCEGVGGLMVPLTPGYLVRDFAVDLGLPVVVAARTGLGTISHSLLTVEAARAAGLTVAGIVMTPWPASPEPIETSNRATVERLADVPVCGLPATAPDRLGEAGAALPLADWVG